MRGSDLKYMKDVEQIKVIDFGNGKTFCLIRTNGDEYKLSELCDGIGVSYLDT